MKVELLIDDATVEIVGMSDLVTIPCLTGVVTSPGSYLITEVAPGGLWTGWDLEASFFALGDIWRS